MLLRLVRTACYLRRSPLSPNLYQTRSYNSSIVNKPSDPWRILFCGSDEFSIKSLEALHAHARNPEAHIKSIDVVTKASKRTGRGLKTWTSPPIASIATKLGLPLHQIDTFTGWSPPVYNDPTEPNINLVVAVSFGLLIPARIIKGAKYGGLNVHPSLLPDLPGAAPIQYAIIKGMRRTGVSVQTLHPTKFDHGVVLAQVAIGIPRPDQITFGELRNHLAPVGADMLLKVLKERRYVAPHESIQEIGISQAVTKAPRIVPVSRAVKFDEMDAGQIHRLHRALGNLWAEAQTSEAGTDWLRVILNAPIRVANDLFSAEDRESLDIPTGLPFAIIPRNEELSQSDASIYIRCKPTHWKPLEDSFLSVGSITVAGSRQGKAAQAAWKAGLFGTPHQLNLLTIYKFHAPLRAPDG